MGLISFVKSAGRALFGKDEEEAPQAPSTAGPSQAEIQALAERKQAARLVQFVQGLGFQVNDLSVRVDGDTATVKGTVGNQADCEKIVLAVGNTEGIASVDDQLEVDNPEPEATYHTVERGDTLSAIAKKYYGNAMKYPVIFEANKPMLEDPDKIYPGQVLRVPPAS
jgi:nucleoid-associated protein YgaU